MTYHALFYFYLTNLSEYHRSILYINMALFIFYRVIFRGRYDLKVSQMGIIMRFKY